MNAWRVACVGSRGTGSTIRLNTFLEQEIDAGKLAASKAANPESKKFGQQMVTDHTGANKQATALVTRLKVTPEDNSTSQSLKTGGDKNIANLKSLKGANSTRHTSTTR